MKIQNFKPQLEVNNLLNVVIALILQALAYLLRFYWPYEQLVVTFLEFRKMLSLRWDSMNQKYDSWIGILVMDESL